MQTEAARGEWFVGAGPALPLPRRRPVVRSAPRDRTAERVALGAVLALTLVGAAVVAAAVALVPGLYTPLF